MQVSIEQPLPDDPDWQQLCDLLKAKVTLSAQVLVAMEVWLARTILEQQLQERLLSHTTGMLAQCVQLDWLAKVLSTEF